MLNIFSKSLSELFLSCRGPMATSVSGSVAGLEGSHTLRRASSIRRAFTAGGQAGMKRHSVAIQVKFQVGYEPCHTCTYKYYISYTVVYIRMSYEITVDFQH